MSDNEQLITLTADIVSSHLANNSVAVSDVSNLIKQVHSALAALAAAPVEEPAGKTPVVSIRASIKPEYLVCMECGQKQKTLKRHLQRAHGMTPEQYRKDYGLPDTYPMVASAYSEKRAELARSSGLGRRRGQSGSPELANNDTPPQPKRGRRAKADTTEA